MSILLRRLLGQAEAKLSESDHAEAEMLCCQVLTGGAALADVLLVADATELLLRIPWVDQTERGKAVLALDNKVSSMQARPVDDETALALAESLVKLTPPYPAIHAGVHNVMIYIAARLGRERRQMYIERLLTLLDDVAAPEGDPATGIDIDVEAGPERAASILAGRGAVLVRRLFEPEQLTALCEAGWRYYAANKGQAVPVEKIGSVEPMRTGPATDFLARMLLPFFPVPPIMQVRQTFMRRVAVNHPETSVPFHQDVQAFGRLLVNVWTPLTACGRGAPGLELVTTRLRDLAATMPAVDQYDDLQISEEIVRERFGEESLYRPEMKPGDVLAFLGTTIHRTHIRPDMTEARLSVELRFGIE